MEAFPYGSHVVIELGDERKIAGFVVGGNVNEGVVLNATHKDVERVFKIGPVTSASIAEQLKSKKTLWLRTSMLARGHFAGALAERADMEAQLQFDNEQDILEQQEDGFDFKELAAPVVTYVHPGAIMLMERSADILKGAELEQQAEAFDASLDDTLEEILTNGEGEDENETKEDKDGEELAGREGEAEAGSSA